MLQSQSIKMPRVAGSQMDTCGSFNQSVAKNRIQGYFIVIPWCYHDESSRASDKGIVLVLALVLDFLPVDYDYEDDADVAQGSFV
jgi:hypothetical protein